MTRFGLKTLFAIVTLAALLASRFESTHQSVAVSLLFGRSYMVNFPEAGGWVFVRVQKKHYSTGGYAVSYNPIIASRPCNNVSEIDYYGP